MLEEIAGSVVDRRVMLDVGMLVATDRGVAFRHELAREAVERSRPHRGPALHRAVLAARPRHRRGARCGAACHHSEAVGGRDGVLRWAPQAAQRAAASGSHREAAAQYARALRFADGIESEALAELLERRAAECFVTNEFDEAIQTLERALALRRELGDTRGTAGTLASLALVMHDAGRARDAEALVGEAVELAEPLGPSRELARAYAGFAQLGMVFQDLKRTIDWGGRAIELAERLNETEALVHALTSVGSMLLNANRNEGREHLERALQLAQQAGLDHAAGRAFNNLAGAGVWSRNYEVAERYVAQGLTFAQDHGLDLFVDSLRASQMILDLDCGRWQQAADTATQQLANPGCTVLARAEALVIIGRVRGRYGDPQAGEALEQALVLADLTGEPQYIYPVAAARAELAWLDGDPEGVGEATNDALALALERADAWSAGELACWRWRAGLRDELPEEHVAEPYRLSIAGEWRSAAERWRELGCPYEAALALADADDDAALRQALEELNGLAARPAAAILARRLRDRGVRGLPRGPRSTTRQNPVGLTARELEVLALLSEGLRNAQIAQRLVVSERTIDHHVSAILRKLDVQTRSQASARAIHLGLTA